MAVRRMNQRNKYGFALWSVALAFGEAKDCGKKTWENDLLDLITVFFRTPFKVEKS